MPPDWHAEARRLKAENPTLSYSAIGRELERAPSSVWKALNREAVAEQRKADNASRREEKRAFDRGPKARASAARRNRTRYRARCQDCGMPCGIGSKHGARGAKRCRACADKVVARGHAKLLSKIERWYNAGLTYRQIADRLGWKHSETLGPYTRELREAGRIKYRQKWRDAA